ncbi:MAG: hypothetical protein JWP81_2489 [Ferruginibacter sp.]|nr:hypothetical protein [Ferruginibacter sp.]
MKQLQYCLLALLWPVVNGFAQPMTAKIPALETGDRIPAITIDHLYNYPASSVRLTDFKGKLLLLDFWSTWCGSCIEGFPKMQALQKEFGSRLQVLLVNTYQGDDIKKVKPFFAKRKALTGEEVSLPYSLLQGSLLAYFPHRFVPHYVWIDASGRVVAITSQLEVTSKNIRAILNGDPVALHTKNDQLEFDTKKPLFVNGNGGSGGPFLYRSMLTPYIEGLGCSSGISRDSAGKISRFYLLNSSLWILLKSAYPALSNFPLNSIVVKTKHAAMHLPGTGVETDVYDASFCYELSLPPSSYEALQAYMQQDIARALKIGVSMEERKGRCLVLKRVDANSLQAGTTKSTTSCWSGDATAACRDRNSFSASNSSQAGTTKSVTSCWSGDATAAIRDSSRASASAVGHETQQQPADDAISISSTGQQYQPVIGLMKQLNKHSVAINMPVIDETGLKGKLAPVLPAGYHAMSLEMLQVFLGRAGFVLTEAERTVPVAVISDL